MFNKPIVLFIFKRANKSVEIIKQISNIKPLKIYLIADGGRTKSEHYDCIICRQLVEKAIDWKCEVIKNYSPTNRGVYENIANGSKWVFSQEEEAIFLEDDNFPELSFFEFCKQLLEKYKDNDQILYIAGTNYLEKVKFQSNSSYVFSQNMFPCGWASWRNKFSKYYDGNLDLYNSESLKVIKKYYKNRVFYNYDVSRFNSEYERKQNNKKFFSWDYQLAFSLRFFNKYCIVPSYNQILNIGVDEHSIHGGNSSNLIMTKRLTRMKSHSLSFPLIHPKVLKVNRKFEHKIEKLLTPPSMYPLNKLIIRIIRRIFRISKTIPLMQGLKDFFKL
jgi:hypothetical protein